MRSITTILLAVLLLGGVGCQGPTSSMTQARLDELVARHAGPTEGRSGSWRFNHDGVDMLCVSDAGADRMRIMAPVLRVTDVTPEQIGAVLVANFHSALDARYAVSGDALYVVYLHPLSSLTEAELVSALGQVATLVRTFGREYTSGGLIFGTPRE